MTDGEPGVGGPAAGETAELTIESLAAGGDGVARGRDGRVVFVPRAAVGDRADIATTLSKKSFARGRIERLIEPSPDRVEPPCALFRDQRCGGCSWQHLSIEAQRRAKVDIVSSAARELVAAGAQLRELLSPVPDYGWRRRARLHWYRPRGADAAIIGLFAPRTRRVTALAQCDQFDPRLSSSLGTLAELLAPGLHKRGEIDLLLAADGRVHVAVHGPANRAALEALAAAADIAGVVSGRGQLGDAHVALETATGRAQDFAQASESGNRALVDAVLQAVGTATSGAAPGRVAEFFAGSGNFSRPIADTGVTLVAVDQQDEPDHLPDAIEYVCGDAFEVGAKIAEAVEKGEDRFDAVLLDPPRSGARALIPVIAAIAAPTVVYVSCDPATMSRDLVDLSSRGYRVNWLQPIDLMPQTAHVEVIAVATGS